MAMILPNPALLAALEPAYAPCRNFGACRDAIWAPDRGQVPRGFLGATGDLRQVRAVMVFAEPGRPYDDEVFDVGAASRVIMEKALSRTYESFRNGQDLFHRNVRWFMSELCPTLSFDDQLKHVWLTEGRLCSFSQEIGDRGDSTCSRTYLSAQLALMPQAKVVAFGGKAKSYLQKARIDHLGAYALAPPGSNHRPARPSWLIALDAIKSAR